MPEKDDEFYICICITVALRHPREPLSLVTLRAKDGSKEVLNKLNWATTSWCKKTYTGKIGGQGTNSIKIEEKTPQEEKKL